LNPTRNSKKTLSLSFSSLIKPPGSIMNYSWSLTFQ
jgi:hypothetical protein